jgi:hypothetical protein
MPSFLWYFLGSMAAASIIYLFCITFLSLKPNTLLTKIFSYVSFVLAIIFIILAPELYEAQTFLVHILLLLILITSIINFASSIKFKSDIVAKVYIFLLFPIILLNYLVVVSFFALPAYFKFERYFNENQQLSNHFVMSSRLIAFSAFITHILFFFLFDNDLLKNGIISGILFSFFGAITSYSIGYYLYTANE